MKPIKQLVYTHVKEINLEENYYLQDLNGEFYLEQKGYFFTPEQFNEYIKNVINQTLETAAEEAICSSDERGLICFIYKESITDTFEETFNKFKV